MAVPLIAIIAIVVIIIVTGGFFALKSRKSAPSMDAPAAPMPAAAPTPAPGVIISHRSVYETGARVIQVTSDVNSTLNNVAAYLKEKNITVPYNYVTTFSDGGFRLYSIPVDTTPVTGPFIQGPGLTVTTYSVPGGGISVSTFALISHFGKSGVSMIMILIILLLAGGLYYLHTQGKLKMPTFKQRIAQFGRTIKSLRKMRG